LAGVRVRDDRKRPPAGGFHLDVGGGDSGQGGSIVRVSKAFKDKRSIIQTVSGLVQRAIVAAMGVICDPFEARTYPPCR
ncbi:MAG TPA: hypothetical protein PLR44_12545, partial [Thermomicrobiales bacterium]|nr:hypothetical protein [Thermomicrobiales bacterium]